MQLQTFRDHGPPDATHNKLHNCTLRSCLLRFLVLEAIIQYSLSGNLSNTTPHSFTTPSPKRRSSPRRCIQAPLLFVLYISHLTPLQLSVVWSSLSDLSRLSFYPPPKTNTVFPHSKGSLSSSNQILSPHCLSLHFPVSPLASGTLLSNKSHNLAFVIAS